MSLKCLEKKLFFYDQEKEKDMLQLKVKYFLREKLFKDMVG
jgi:hypothetical protein